MIVGMDDIEEIIGGLGAGQHGTVSYQQLVERGVAVREIERRLRRGALLRRSEGIYVINGSPDSIRQRMWLAMLAPTAMEVALSHESAAELHRFAFVPRGRVVLTMAPTAQHRRPVDRVHRYQDLRPGFTTVVDGLRVTTRERTMIDLAAVLRPARLERVLDDQLSSNGLAYIGLVGVFNAMARRGRRGIGRLRPFLEVRGDGYVAPTTELEARLVGIVRDHDLPEPSRQHLPPWAVAEGIGRVDFAYADYRVLIEVDGRRWHSRDVANEQDRFRDQQAAAAGWLVLRYTWTQITKSPSYVAKNLKSVLARAVA